MNKRCPLILAVIVVLAAAPAFASGFGFYEQGAKASGQAGAWVARADDASANWYNPAALVNLTGREVQFGFNYLQPGNDTQFSPTSDPSKSIDAVSNGAAPGHFYFSQKINDRVAWGVGLNNPFGLMTEWDDTDITPYSRSSELRTYLLNPNVAFKLGNYWSVAVGADYISVEVRDYSRDLSIVGPVTANLTGEGDAWGYNFALQFKMKSFSIAGQYRSALRTELFGDFTVSTPLTSSSQDATTYLDLPGQTMLGAAWTSDRVDIEVGGYYTQWNYFKSLDITLPPATSPAQTIPEYWEGSWSYRLGIAVRLDKGLKHELRIGGVLDETPIAPEYLRPSIPDADRMGYTLGYGYQAKRWGIDIYGMFMDFDDATAVGSQPGVIDGTYTTTIVLAGVTAKYRF
jgi:long-chain fatty acid transport protein